MDDQFSELQLPESRVLIIITGGTICMRKSADGLVPARGFLKAGLAPRPVFNDGSYPEPLEIVTDDHGTRKAVQSLRTPASTYDRRVRYCVLEFEKLLDSSSIDSAGWDQIAKTVQRNYQLFDGFVILHGTDSLAYSASALSFMFHNLGKPVILTGSQAPMMELQTDAQDNLLNSLIIAGHFMIPEVCLFFNFKLFRGNRSTKVSAEDFDAFGSPNLPPLATISSTRTNVLWHRVHRSTDLSPFSVQTGLDTAHVVCLRIFPGITPVLVDAVLRLEGLKGLVLETFGAGNTPGGPDSAMTRILADAVKRGIVIVNVTQCLSGSVSALYAPGTFLGRAGVVFGQDLTTEAALTKLAYLLALPDATPEMVAKQMMISVRGELTETTRTHFEHPEKSGVLTPELSSLTALGYAIQKGDLQETRDIIRGERRWLLNDADYNMNNPVHLAATSPNAEILRDFLSQGASVHLRNRSGNTPLFLAAAAGLKEHVHILIDAGAHLHTEEMSAAKRHASEGDGNAEVWRLVIG
ncbi:asparaginase-domain-containing protein [Dothidotthia symphoricarpi CBS 119687]|uniref:asparaginase n=1 Tax=Dothidotthia symphoricarpi CBS 119687 TaxID=1392245 RepID=A0A6A6A312_9PLEO|nr:asparaginase-domain-containing protein [Dothidotthia symphoricarpi CBS 119687]KAF2125553.1 asparaginase-domain-containing protein [Dothidotthia symphoricarpi CBS 119687]